MWKHLLFGSARRHYPYSGQKQHQCTNRHQGWWRWMLRAMKAFSLNLSGRSRGRRQVRSGEGRTKDTLTTITPAGTGRPLGSSRMPIWPGQCFRRLNPARVDLPAKPFAWFPIAGWSRQKWTVYLVFAWGERKGSPYVLGWDLHNIRKLWVIKCGSVLGRVWPENHSGHITSRDLKLQIIPECHSGNLAHWIAGYSILCHAGLFVLHLCYFKYTVYIYSIQVILTIT